MLIDAKNEEVKKGTISLEEVQEQVNAYILGKAEETGKSVRISRDVYGVRLVALAGPIWKADNSEVVGTWVLATPRQHNIVKAFDSFAPVIGGLLPEGGFIYLNDKQKFLKRQSSEKFDAYITLLG